MKMLPNCFNFLTTIKMIFLESINFSLIKINTIIFVLFSKIQPKVWNLFRTNLINFVKFSTIWSSYNVSDLPKPLKIYCILCTSMGYVVQRPNAYFEDNPDIGYIWVFIEFSVSLDLLDEKKNHICPSQMLSNFFYGAFSKRVLSGQIYKGK